MQDIKVKEIMSGDVCCISPDATLQEVITVMRDNHASCVVATEHGMPVGIITEFDFIRLLADIPYASVFAPVKLADIMSKPVITVSENTSLFDSLVITTAQKLRHIPVVDEDGRVAGIVTLVDLAQAHFHSYEKQREIIEQSITSRTRELLEANEKLKALSLVDALMGISNRRAMEVDLEHTHAQALRYGHSYSIALLDIDFFKLYNDCYGHLAGDTALRTVAGAISGQIRTSDRVYRYGGEEILLLLPETPPEGAQILVNRVLHKVKQLGIQHQESPFNVITVSAGIATYDKAGTDCKTWKALVSVADRGLYQAKMCGKNQLAWCENTDLKETLMDCINPFEGETTIAAAC